MIALIGRIRSRVTVLLVEHDMDAVFQSPTASRCWSTDASSRPTFPKNSRQRGSARAYLGDEVAA